MAYFLSIMTGPEEGKVAEIVGECMIGRSGDAGLQIEDESVSWEHAIVREVGDKLILENLSALGTDVNGASAVGETKLSHGDEIELSPRCIIKVDSRMTAGSVKRGNPAVLIAGVVVAVVVVFLGVAWFAVTAATQVAAAAGTGGPPSQDEWITAYAKIDARLAQWERRGRVSDDLIGRFKEAWEIEQIEGPTVAHEHWTSLWSSLISQPVPGSSNALIGAEQDEQPAALFALMGRGGDANEPKWDSDESYANALVWFVRARTMQTKPEQ